MEISEKFCPVCKNKNERYATICKHCGAPMEQNPTDLIATTKDTSGLTKRPENLSDNPIDDALIPEDGVAIYAAGTPKPFYLHVKDELVIGRKIEETSDTFLDFSDLDGFNMGLSRRHVKIHRAEKGYEIVDLSSTNGTWLNDERLVPDKPYQLRNGSQLRLGRLRLLILFHSVPKNVENK